MLSTNQEYKDQIKTVGNYKLKDTYKWNEVGRYFNEHGYYCEHIEETADWHRFWDKEEDKIRNGVWIDGFYVPGLYYFYLNYLPIYKKQENKYDFPNIYDMDYHTFLCLEHALFLKKHFVVIKKRQAGFSLKFIVPLIFELWFSNGSPNYMATYEETQVLKNWSDILEPYKEHLNTFTAWYRELKPDRPLNWRVAKEVTEKGRKLLRGRFNTLKGLVLSKSASKGVGGGAKYIFADECFGKGTKVIMYDRTIKNIEDIQIGDFVMGNDGSSKKVIGVYKGIDNLYKIHQRKGIDYIVNSKHKLVLEKRNNYSNNGIKYLNVNEFEQNLNKYEKRTHYGIKNDLIQYEEKELIINPYFFGLWLGDGTKNACEITGNFDKDVETFNFIKNYSNSIGYNISVNPHSINKNIKTVRVLSGKKHNFITKEFKKLNVFNNKHIPDIYLYNSEKNRLEILAGIIDSDGYLTKGTNSFSFGYEIACQKEDLKNDIVFLARSLGYYVNIKQKPAKISILKNGNIINGKSYYSINIRGDISRIPVKIQRKITPLNYKKIKNRNHLITSFNIEHVGVGDYYGISIDGDKKLFLLEDFTVVHNCGVNPVLSRFVGYASNQLRYGDVTTGMLIVSGAVGELKHLEGGFKEYITNPEAHNFYYVENIWDKNNGYAGKRCGFFVPENWAYYTDDGRFVDKDGNSDVEGARERILEIRREKMEQSIETYRFYVSQSPLNLEECFQYRSEAIFPELIVQNQLAILEAKKEYGIYIDLFRDKTGIIKHKLLSKYEYSPIIDYPIKKDMKKDGVIQVFEFPMENCAYGINWGGVDITRDSESLTSPSVHVIYIFKGSHNLSMEYSSEQVVACLKCRPKDKFEFYRKAMLLIEWYNAEALVENNVRWFIEEAIKDKKQGRLTKSPKWLLDITPTAQSHKTTPYGVPMTEKLWEECIDELVRYVSEVIYVEYNDETGEPIEHYGVERIKDVFILKEMLAYKPKKDRTSHDNYDALPALGLALLQARRSEIMGIIVQDTPEIYDNNIKNIKLRMRSNYLSDSMMNKLKKELNKLNYRR